MSNRTFYLARRKYERKAFANVLKAVPEGRLDFRPDPKARTAHELAWLLAYEEEALLALVETGTVEWKDQKPTATAADIAAMYERAASAIDERLARLDDAAWDQKGKLVMAGMPAWEDTISNFAWGFLCDAIHHRGQLSTYLRPMGGKVPSIYGPSADDPGQ
jgi:uncharacterized damage-inducible protein DinB